MKNEYEIRGDVSAIIISSRKYGRIETIISTSDLARVKEFPYTWGVKWSEGVSSFYVIGGLMKPDGGKVTCSLHRWILGVTDKSVFVDHINHDTLNNTRNNLNEVTNAENQQNRLISTDNKSGHIGVTWHKQTGKWRAQIRKDGRDIHLGLFNDINDAIEARKEGEMRYYTYKMKISENEAM
jgi:hypothetical protein